jgi:hypothetical protein
MADDEFRMPRPDPALKRLDFLVGTWRLDGTLEAGAMGPGGTLSGTETFEWLPGGFFLVHHWDGLFDVGGATMIDTGYEFFDYDPAAGAYRAHFFNSLGPYDETASKYVGDFEGTALVVTGPARIARRPEGPDRIGYEGEVPDGAGGWIPWMRATLTRTSEYSQQSGHHG